jgi:hypothetical protein
MPLLHKRGGISFLPLWSNGYGYTLLWCKCEFDSRRGHVINIYQDVDGVLSPFSNGAPKTNTNWRGEWRTEKLGGFPMLWSVELMDALSSLDSREDTAFRWLTSWEDMAPEFLSPYFGIGADWPVLGSNGEQGDLKTWWKLRAMREDIEDTQPDKIIWLDDDIPYDVGGKEFVREMGGRILAISPNKNHGLTAKHIASMIEFIKD